MDFFSLCKISMNDKGNLNGAKAQFEYPFFVTLLKRLESTFAGVDIDKLMKFFIKHDAHIFGSWIIEGLLNKTFGDSDIDLIFPADKFEEILSRKEPFESYSLFNQYTGPLTDVLGMHSDEYPLYHQSDYGLFYDDCDCKMHKNLKLITIGVLPSGKKINIVFVDNPVDFILSAKDITLTQNIFSFKTFVLYSNSKEQLLLKTFSVPELSMDDCPRFRSFDSESGTYKSSANLYLARQILRDRVLKYKSREFIEDGSSKNDWFFDGKIRQFTRVSSLN